MNSRESPILLHQSQGESIILKNLTFSQNLLSLNSILNIQDGVSELLIEDIIFEDESKPLSDS